LGSMYEILHEFLKHIHLFFIITCKFIVNKAHRYQIESPLLYPRRLQSKSLAHF